jgi:hypothetical protein
MRAAVLLLAALNAVVWGAYLAFTPGSHFTPPSSYFGWWFDDLPWTVLFVSGALPALLVVSRLCDIGGLKACLIVSTSISLVAILPYAALSSGGV